MTPAQDRAGPVDLVHAIVADAKAAAAAEIGVVKAIAAHRASGLKLAVPLMLAALFVAQALVTALFVGLILSLSPLIGPAWSTLVAAIVGLVLIGLLAWAGIGKARTLWEPIDDKGPLS